MTKKSEQISLTQPDEYLCTRLQAFFEQIWNGPYAYRVAMARRCFNLSYVLGGGHHNVISHNALLLYAKEMSEHYRQFGFFKQIVIFDDILLYGRNISRVLYTLEEVILKELQRDRTLEGLSDLRRAIHVALMDAVEIRVFAKNKHPSLINSSFLWKVKSEEDLYDNELLVLSEHVSAFLRKTGVANICYAFSCMVSQEKFEKLNASQGEWKRIKWKYAGYEDTFFFRKTVLYCGDGSLPCTQAIQIYTRAQSGIEDRHLVSHVIYEELDLITLRNFCHEIEKALPKTTFARLKEILLVEESYLQKQRAQLLSLILSILAAHDFWGTYFPEEKLEARSPKSDVDRIAANFTRNEEIEEGIRKLISDSSTINKLKACMDMTVLPSFEQAESLNVYGDTECWSVDDQAENIACKAGMDSELDAYQCGQNLKKFKPLKRVAGVVALNDYLQDISSSRKADNQVTEQIFSKENRLACTLMLVNNGILSMNYELDDKEQRVQCTLKAGELSTFIIPRRYHVFMPVLAMVEQECWRLDREPEHVVLRFIDSLEPRCSASSAEVYLLEGLKREWPGYMKALYKCNKSIGRWDIGLSAKDDWQRSGTRNYFDHLIEEFDQEDYYMKKAKDYLGIK